MLLIVQNTFEVSLIDAETSEVATLFVNMFISISYPLNFIIYCTMSHQFRAQFSTMFGRPMPGGSCDSRNVDSMRRASNSCRQYRCAYELVSALRQV